MTTTYIGATDPHALRRLVEQFGAEIKVQYDIRRTRLHAKAWLFRRNTGFDTAYVGSSNLSKAALLEGLEWNVRLSAIATPALISKFRATFDSYWADESFESYVPDRDEERLKEALAEAQAGAPPTESRFRSQDWMFDRTRIRPRCSRHSKQSARCTTVTGTSWWPRRVPERQSSPHSTIGALREKADGRDLSLLFIAHRGEILRQSLRTYREVLADGSFGESYHGGEIPTRWKHVFASVQSLAQVDLSTMRPDAYDVVVD